MHVIIIIFSLLVTPRVSAPGKKVKQGKVKRVDVDMEEDVVDIRSKRAMLFMVTQPKDSPRR
jgi:hypothetical protein